MLAKQEQIAVARPRREVGQKTTTIPSLRQAVKCGGKNFLLLEGKKFPISSSARVVASRSARPYGVGDGRGVLERCSGSTCGAAKGKPCVRREGAGPSCARKPHGTLGHERSRKDFPYLAIVHLVHGQTMSSDRSFGSKNKTLLFDHSFHDIFYVSLFVVCLLTLFCHLFELVLVPTRILVRSQLDSVIFNFSRTCRLMNEDLQSDFQLVQTLPCDVGRSVSGC